MAINLNKLSFGPLAEGEHVAILINYTPFQHQTDSSKDYVRLDLKLPEDSDRIINDNRFEKGLDIAVSQLRKQLGIPNDTKLTIAELLNSLTSTAKPIKIWVSNQTVIDDNGNSTTYRNINYFPPLATAKPAASTASTETVSPDVM